MTVCDSGCDYTTIQAAHNAMTTGQANTITVTGTYTGNERVTVSKSGASVGSELNIVASGTQTMKGFDIDGSYIIIDGFQLTGQATAYTGLIQLSASNSYIIIRNNTVHDTADSVYHVYHNSVTHIVANYPDHITITGNTFRDTQYPMISLPCNNCTISSNTFGPSINNSTANDMDAMRLWGHDTTVSNNTIYDIRGTGGGHNDPIQTYGNNGDTLYDFVFEKNLIYSTAAPESTDTQPCNLSGDGVETMGNLTFRNNIFINVGGHCTIGIQGVHWYNNTFYNSTRNTGNVLDYYTNWGGTGTYYTGTGTIKNNAFIGCGSEDGDNDSRGWWGVQAGGASVTASNNYVSKTAASSYGSKSGWNTDDGNVNGGNPQFASAGGTTKASYAIGAASVLKDVGATIAGFSTDTAGTSRPQGAAWDIGAYEYITYPSASIGSGATMSIGTGATMTVH